MTELKSLVAVAIEARRHRLEAIAAADNSVKQRQQLCTLVTTCRDNLTAEKEKLSLLLKQNPGIRPGTEARAAEVNSKNIKIINMCAKNVQNFDDQLGTLTMVESDNNELVDSSRDKLTKVGGIYVKANRDVITEYRKICINITNPTTESLMTKLSYMLFRSDNNESTQKLINAITYLSNGTMPMDSIDMIVDILADIYPTDEATDETETDEAATDETKTTMAIDVANQAVITMEKQRKYEVMRDDSTTLFTALDDARDSATQHQLKFNDASLKYNVTDPKFIVMHKANQTAMVNLFNATKAYENNRDGSTVAFSEYSNSLADLAVLTAAYAN